MNVVEPIRDKELIRDIVEYLRTEGRHGERNAMIVLCGIYFGLRITDLLSLKVRDVKNKDEFMFVEEKTVKAKKTRMLNHSKPIKKRIERFIKIPKGFKKELNEYIKDKNNWDYLFPSRKKNINGVAKPLNRNQVNRILKDVANKFGLRNCACHSLRKTFGYFLYRSSQDIEVVRIALHHSNHAVTRRYIGLEQDMISELVDELKF